jgi:hypothetical protein
VGLTIQQKTAESIPCAGELAAHLRARVRSDVMRS